jgi:hypothetical protein
MLREPFFLVAGIFAFGPVLAADLPDGYAPRHSRTVAVKKESDLLFTPSGAFPRIAFPPHTPTLLGSATLPGYYGSTHSYDYQGPYYGGESISYQYRLPYACGVLGYC